MAKKVDITDKLTFDGNPYLVIKGKEIEVNADAPTMLKVMNMMTVDGAEIEQVSEAYALIFPEKSKAVIDGMELGVKDWLTVVTEAMSLIMGEDTSRGEERPVLRSVR